MKRLHLEAEFKDFRLDKR